MKHILFVCTGNTCRSPMAEVLFRALCQKQALTQFTCSSAGLAAFEGESAHLNAIMAMEEKGISLTSHKARRLTPALMEQSDRIVTMTASQAAFLQLSTDKVLSFTPDIDDPYGGSMETYKACAAQIELALTALLPRLQEEA